VKYYQSRGITYERYEWEHIGIKLDQTTAILHETETTQTTVIFFSKCKIVQIQELNTREFWIRDNVINDLKEELQPDLEPGAKPTKYLGAKFKFDGNSMSSRVFKQGFKGLFYQL
jgi:hypothetical protein